MQASRACADAYPLTQRHSHLRANAVELRRNRLRKQNFGQRDQWSANGRAPLSQIVIVVVGIILQFVVVIVVALPASSLIALDRDETLHEGRYAAWDDTTRTENDDDQEREDDDDDNDHDLR